MPNDGIRLKIILIIEVRKLEFTDFDSHSPVIGFSFIDKRYAKTPYSTNRRSLSGFTLIDQLE